MSVVRCAFIESRRDEMPAKYFLRKEEDCLKCNGRGVVQHPAWEEYWKMNAGKPTMSLKEDLVWFESHGWIEAAGHRFETDNDGLPSEEIVCRTCEGECVIEEEVDLMDVLPKIFETLNLKVNVE